MDKMEPIARALGIDTSDEDDFWRERVALECNKAVVHSFRRDGHSIVDHVTAQAQVSQIIRQTMDVISLYFTLMPTPTLFQTKSSSHLINEKNEKVGRWLRSGVGLCLPLEGRLFRVSIDWHLVGELSANAYIFLTFSFLV